VGIAVLTVRALAMVAALLPPVEAGEPPSAAAYRQVLATPGAAATVLTTLLFMASQFTVYGVAGAYVSARFGLSTGRVAVVLLAFGVLGVIGNASGARIFERLGGPNTITLTLCGLAVAFATLVFAAKAFIAAVALFAFWAFFSQLYQAPQQARLVALLPRQRAILLALNASTMYVGVSLGSLLGSSFLPALGPRALSAVALAPLALAMVAHLASVRRVVAAPTTMPATPIPTRS